jgi:hypothetical protein
MELEDLEPGFYYCFGHKGPDGEPKPELDYAIIFVRGAFGPSFPQAINCLSPETQANNVVPLSSEHRQVLGEGLGEWIRRQIEKYPELNTHLRGDKRKRLKFE